MKSELLDALRGLADGWDPALWDRSAAPAAAAGVAGLVQRVVDESLAQCEHDSITVSCSICAGLDCDHHWIPLAVGQVTDSHQPGRSEAIVKLFCSGCREQAWPAPNDPRRHG